MKIVKIGRNPQNDVVINDEFVSGTHCQIIQDDRGNCTLIDTNSSNGTYVNGVLRHGEVRLSPTDMVRIGHTNLPWQNYFDSPVRNGMHQQHGGGQNYANKPDNFMVPAILCIIFLSLVFGIVSVVFAAKVNKQWEAGDYDGAMESARKARTWFWVGLGLGVFRYLILLTM